MIERNFALASRREVAKHDAAAAAAQMGQIVAVRRKRRARRSLRSAPAGASLADRAEVRSRQTSTATCMCSSHSWRTNRRSCRCLRSAPLVRMEIDCATPAGRLQPPCPQRREQTRDFVDRAGRSRHDPRPVGEEHRFAVVCRMLEALFAASIYCKEVHIRLRGSVDRVVICDQLSIGRERWRLRVIAPSERLQRLYLSAEIDRRDCASNWPSWPTPRCAHPLEPIQRCARRIG